MNSIWNFVNNLYKEVNGATLTGAIDVIVIQQEDGSYLSSPFHVRFGKIGVLRSREKVVDIEINGEPINIHMKLGESGEAFFVEETSDSFEFPSYLATSPINSYTDMGAEIKKMKQRIADGVDPESDSSSDLPKMVRAGEPTPPTSTTTTFFPDRSHHATDSPGHLTEVTVDSPSTSNNTATDVIVDPYQDDGALTELLATVNVSQADLERVKIRLTELLRNGGATMEGAREGELTLMRKIASGNGVTVQEIAAAVHACSPESSSSSSQFKPIRLPDDDGLATRGAAAFATPSPVAAVPEGSATSSATSEAIDVPSADNDAEKGKAKKKRKRKSTVRRKLQQSRSSQVLAVAADSYGGGNGGGSSSNSLSNNRDNSPSSEEPSEEIFQMDADLEEMAAQAGVVVTGGPRELHPSRSQSDLMTASGTSDYQEMAASQSGVVATGGPRDLHPSRSQNDLMTTSGTSDYQECNIISTDEWQYKTLQTQRSFHPFSDGETSAAVSPVNSRPSTPKSDSEYEIHKMDNNMLEDDEHRWSWTWGELPVPPKVPSEPQREEAASDDDNSEKAKQIKKDQEEQRSTLGGVFQLSSKTKKERQASSESEGRYLDELNVTDLDPEVAQLYFSRNSTWTGHLQNKDTHTKDDDSESGNGSSLPQSPHSVEGAIGGGPSSGVDSDLDERSIEPQSKELHGVAFSLCGNLESLGSSVPEDKFDQTLVTYDNFCNTPNMINNPNLVIRISGKYYNWQTAAPILMSVMVFQRQLPETVVTNLVKDHMPEKPKKSEGTRYSWFKWGRSPAPEADNKKTDMSQNQLTQSPSKSSNLLDINQDGHKANESTPNAFNQDKRDSLNRSSDLDSSQVFPESDLASLVSPSTEKYKKSLRLTSEKIAKLNLHEGPNEVVFSVTTAYQGTTRCKCHIYLWKYDDQIIISDIDGTITKSDVLGHILPIVGTSWAQSGVAQLFTNIKRNGYQFLYLSARAIGQARVTRDYLRSIRQGDLSLPDGPLLLSPSSLLSALRREVIEKKPEEFKISCLRDIQALFVNKNPFYAGYGNKVNDVWAYRAVGIPMSRIFTINHRGELKYELNRTFQSSYAGMSYVVDHVFPPLLRTSYNNGLLTADFVAAEEFSSFTYWRDPLPDIVIELEEVLRLEKGEEKK